MRKRSLILVAFLMVLYIGPILFISSYGHSGIVAEPNMVKDFSLSDGEGWLTGWSDRKGITITNSSGAGTDYQIMIDVTYEDEMETDFADIRFTDKGGVALLDYWRETYTVSTSAVFWVEITDDLDFETVIYMYSGNSEATTLSNGTNTFIFFDDFENDNLDGWDTVGAAWDTTIAFSKYGSYSAFGDSQAGSVLRTNLTSTIDYSIMVHSWARFLLTVATEYPIVTYEQDGTLVYAMYSPANEFSTYDGSSVKDYFTDGQTGTTWIRLEIAFDFENELLVPYVDRVHKTDQDLLTSETTTITDINSVGSSTSATINQDHWLDDYYVRKWLAVEPIASFGIWYEVGEAILFFEVPFDMWGFDSGLIFLGLCMIPVSMLYLAYGIKHDRSSNRLFYGLIIFFMGCGLFIGGIMP